MGFVGLVFLVAMVDCLQPPTGATQAQNADSELQCVLDHWGQPVETIALACTANEITLAEDLLADVEALLEKSSAPDGGMFSNPYRDNPRIQGKLAERRARVSK
jgi:hypothetical protein